MSKVDHPAHYGGDTTYECIKVLAAWLSPAEFIGFCRGNQIKYLSRAMAKGGLEDFDKSTRYGEFIKSFVQTQRLQGEPDGFPVPPVYWTEELGPQDDREELIACMDGSTVFALHSSVDPHMQWVVRMPIGEGEFEVETFPTKAAGENAIKELQEENRRQYGIMIAEVRHLYSMGDVEGAESRMEAWGDLDIAETERGDPGHVTIEGERIKIGGGVLEAKRRDAVEAVKAHLREGNFDRADAICASYDFGYAWDSANPHVAWVNGESLDLFTFNVRNPNPEAPTERQVPRSIPSSANE
jgi:hypothetical protein